MTRRPHLSPTLRRTSVAAGVLVLAAALGACGGDDGDGGDSGDGGDGGSSALAEDEASTALLTLDDLPDGFTETEDDDEEEDSQVGCLGATEDLSDLEATTKTEVNFEMEGETGAAGILSGVNSYDDVDTITEGIAAFREALADCTSVEETDEDDFTIALDVSLDDEAVSDLVDEQANLRAEGSISGGDASFPYVVQFAVSRIDNSIAVVAVYEVGESTGVLDGFDALNETMVARLDEANQG